MRGIVLAGGKGTRLLPVTRVTNKHLLPVYNKPMIYYPLEALKACGVTNTLLISGREHAGHFLNLLGSGRALGIDLSYDLQEEAGGIAEALGIAEDFSDGEKIAVILGDNIFTDFRELKKGVWDFKRQRRGAKIFLRETNEAQRFGVAEVQGGKIIGIEEKPKYPKSNLAVTGFYLYDNQVFDIIRTLKPSRRGELEITDVNNRYITRGQMTFQRVQGEWTDAGTIDTLLRASMLAAGVKI